MGIDFKADSFDFEEEMKKQKVELNKPNILLCGATGVGKSSLVNDLFGEHLAEVGEGEPVSRGVSLHTGDRLSVNLYDSEGYEIGDEKQSYYIDEIISVIDKKSREHEGNFKEYIHEVWYCISAANKRITDTDFSLLEKLLAKKVPVAVIFTQVDSVDQDELFALQNELKKKYPGINSFTYCVAENEQMREQLKEYIQKDKLIDWALKNLDDSLKEGLMSALYGCILKKKDYVSKKIIPKYTASAVAAAANPIPMADAALLTPIQMGMTVHIINVYGLSQIGGAVTCALETEVMTQIGRFLAKTLTGNILKLIPGIGDIAGGAINVAVATALTIALGKTISQLCYLYSEAILEGKTVGIEDYFNKEMFEAVMKSFKEK